MIRFLALVAAAWFLGFGWFAFVRPGPAGEQKTDGVVVLTGAEGRIPRGIDALRQHWARHMLVSGVDREVKPREFAIEYKLDQATMRCCVTLGYRSTDTRSNALETARWVAAKDLHSIRLVTTDWHMRRAAADLAAAAPGVTVLEDAVPAKAGWRVLINEFNKMLLRRVQIWTGA